MVLCTLQKRWEILRQIDLQKMPILTKKIIFVKCYADKPETIDALKENIREAICEMQLHTIDNVLKNGTDRVGY